MESTIGQLPPVRLLVAPTFDFEDKETSKGKETAQKLMAKLSNMGATATLVRTVQGPVITTFYIRLDDEVRFSKIAGLEEDVALALKAKTVNIAREPGTDTIAVEVARDDRQLVRLRSVLGSPDYYNTFHRGLKLALGVKRDGEPMVFDLTTAPHLLIAGATGGGKSISLHTIILSLLYRFTPEELELSMIDMKMVELGVYGGIPHLSRSIATEPDDGLEMLEALVEEIRHRYNMMARVGVRDIETYQKRHRFLPDCDDPWIPYSVIIIDEFADLMMTSKKAAETAVIRISQLGRAAGVHLILATQRPTVNVMTGLIKGNVPSRLAFKTSSRVDSMVILDSTGAENLLGKGDGLLRTTSNDLIRFQGAFVSSEEVQKVVEYITGD